ncbi:MAG: site-2 protease family protein [Pirellulales bacterium]|nr:site-2 protease family protein [Pirellulales bacterium]
MDESKRDEEAIPPARVIDIIAPDGVEYAQASPAYRPPARRNLRPLVLFIATCLSTLFVGILNSAGNYDLYEVLARGFLYSASLMTILICHEMGHFLQSRRYGIAASWPYFIPIPLQPIGTMGAVIVMEPRMGHRRALFDIGITGPLAGLIPTIICCIVGIIISKEFVYIPPNANLHSLPGIFVGEPLLFTWLTEWFGPPLPPSCVRVLHPVAFAGWVGLLITSLNLIPIGQLDGGHILYALLKKKAHLVATFLLYAAFAAVVLHYKDLWGWTLMLILLSMMGPKHPPTANDDEPLGFFRYVLGWLTLGFVVIGFTSMPFHFS